MTVLRAPDTTSGALIGRIGGAPIAAFSAALKATAGLVMYAASMYTRPWSWMRDYSWRPDMTLFHEYNCELQTGAKGGVDPSLVPEPQD